ncbi:MAG: amidase [Micavibrio sp.]|nr:amidase [Micavibrio sp.]|tara:strand:+ start:366 stop:866 length:501 start_codon:yes stop_codon:yes gene_type:complete
MIRIPLFYIALISLLTLSGCAGFAGRIASPSAYGQYHLSPTQCVPYARAKSGIQIYGDAYTWWQQASSRGYQRGQAPRQGAILSLSQTSKLRYGHLAVVKKIKASREITVTHSNWGDGPVSRRMVYKSMKVKDISPNNDWTMVKFWNPEIDAYGLPYKADGFIYAD